MTHKEFTELVFEAIEGSDYSSEAKLRDLASGEIHAISRLLHDFDIEPTEGNCLRAARHRHGVYRDESDLANAVFPIFIDQVDSMGFRSSSMDQIVHWTAERALAKFYGMGFYVINLSSPVEHEGTYVFTKGALG